MHFVLACVLLSTAPAQPAASPQKAQAPRKESEMTLLERARILLGSSQPKQALELAEQHRRKYPNGMFVQDREIITIQALCELGRIKEAKVRLQQFDKTFPNSPNRTRVHDMVDHPKKPHQVR
jgi:outer membrane protein assembly factor BamD (BamD/ComL family)